MIFVAGGMTYSETRAAYTAANERGQHDVIVGARSRLSCVADACIDFLYRRAKLC